MHDLDAEELWGTVVGVPIVNVYGFPARVAVSTGPARFESLLPGLAGRKLRVTHRPRFF